MIPEIGHFSLILALSLAIARVCSLSLVLTETIWR